MSKTEPVLDVVNSIRRTQTGLEQRKESFSALVALIAWVAALVADNVDSIPVEAGIAGQVIAVVCSVVAVGIARFTVPALTEGQAKQLVSRAETLQAREEAASGAGTLPTYTGVSTAD